MFYYRSNKHYLKGSFSHGQILNNIRDKSHEAVKTKRVSLPNTSPNCTRLCVTDCFEIQFLADQSCGILLT